MFESDKLTAGTFGADETTGAVIGLGVGLGTGFELGLLCGFSVTLGIEVGVGLLVTFGVSVGSTGVISASNGFDVDTGVSVGFSVVAAGVGVVIVTDALVTGKTGLLSSGISGVAVGLSVSSGLGVRINSGSYSELILNVTSSPILQKSFENNAVQYEYPFAVLPKL